MSKRIPVNGFGVPCILPQLLAIYLSQKPIGYV